MVGRSEPSPCSHGVRKTHSNRDPTPKVSQTSVPSTRSSVPLSVRKTRVLYLRPSVFQVR